MSWTDTVGHVLELLQNPANGVQALAGSLPQDADLSDLVTLWLSWQLPEGAYDPTWTWCRERSLLLCENQQHAYGQSLATLVGAVRRAIGLRLHAGLRDDRLVCTADF